MGVCCIKVIYSFQEMPTTEMSLYLFKGSFVSSKISWSLSLIAFVYFILTLFLGNMSPLYCRIFLPLYRLSDYSIYIWRLIDILFYSILLRDLLFSVLILLFVLKIFQVFCHILCQQTSFYFFSDSYTFNILYIQKIGRILAFLLTSGNISSAFPWS